MGSEMCIRDRADTAAPAGDLQRAHDYLQKVLLAGTDMTPVAEELLARLQKQI